MNQDVEKAIQNEGKGERKPWDDITPAYIEQVCKKTEGAFQEEYEEGMNSYSVADIRITEISRSKKSTPKETAKFRIEFNIVLDPEEDEDDEDNIIRDCSVIITSPVECDVTNITLFEDKVYEAIDGAIESELDEM